MEILLLLDVNSSTFWKWHALNFNGKMLAFHCFKFLPVLPSYPFQRFEIKFSLYFWIKTVFSLPCLKITKWLHMWLGRKTERQGANVFLIHAFFFHGSVSKQHPLFPNKTIHCFCSYVWISFRLKHNCCPTILSVSTRQKDDKENTDDGEKWSNLDKVKCL